MYILQVVDSPPGGSGLSPLSPQPDSGDGLGTALFLLGHLFIRLRPGDISLAASSTLVTLNDCGPLRITALAEAEGVTQPSMSELVNRLQRDGLVVRQRDPGDSRAVNVEITSAGRAMVAERRRERADRLAELVATLDRADQQALLAAEPAMRRLVANGLARLASDQAHPSQHPLQG